MTETFVPIHATIFENQCSRIGEIATAEERTFSGALRRVIRAGLASYEHAQRDLEASTTELPPVPMEAQ